MQYGADTALAYIDLLAEPGELYKRASDTVRRDLLSAYFEHLDVYLHDEGLKVDAGRNEANVTVRGLTSATQPATEPHTARKTKTPRSKAGSLENQMVSSFDHGSSNVHVAGDSGYVSGRNIPCQL